MGLLPCLLRASASYLSNDPTNNDSNDDSILTSVPNKEIIVSDNSDRLLWIEMIFSLTLALIDATPALHALTGI
jgi:hypothetical protein